MVRGKTRGRRAFRIRVGIILMLILLAGSAYAATSINSCSTISAPGEYVLNQSMINSSASSSPGAPAIIGFAPSSPVSDVVGAARAFNITVNQTVNVTWLINGIQVQLNESVTAASCTNESAAQGTWNVSAIAANPNGTAMQIWTWNVAPLFAPVVYVEPGYLSIPRGSNFTVSISVDPKNTRVYAAQYDLHFDPSKIEVINQKNETFLIQDGNSTNILLNIWNNTIGTASYGEMRTGVQSGVTQPGVLASIAFHVNGTAPEGNTTLDLKNVTLKDPQPSPIPGVAVIDGTVNILNIPPVAIASTNHTVNNNGSKAFLNCSASYDPDGHIIAYNWSFGDGTNGSGSSISHIYNRYNWNGTAYLPFNVTLTLTDNNGATNSTTFKVRIYMAGDANGDGWANADDASLVRLHMNTYYGQPGYDDGADLNNDDIVNILDAAIVGLNWGKHA